MWETRSVKGPAESTWPLGVIIALLHIDMGGLHCDVCPSLPQTANPLRAKIETHPAIVESPEVRELLPVSL